MLLNPFHPSSPPGGRPLRRVHPQPPPAPPPVLAHPAGGPQTLRREPPGEDLRHRGAGGVAAEDAAEGEGEE